MYQKWSGRLDSNQRPPAPHTGALPSCATPRCFLSCFALESDHMHYGLCVHGVSQTHLYFIIQASMQHTYYMHFGTCCQLRKTAHDQPIGCERRPLLQSSLLVYLHELHVPEMQSARIGARGIVSLQKGMDVQVAQVLILRLVRENDADLVGSGIHNLLIRS